MNYFYVKEDTTLVPLVSFQFSEGQSHVVRIPTFDGPVYSPSRKGPDTFSMVVRTPMPHFGQFRVIDESGVVYECLGNSINNNSVSGYVTDRWEVEAGHKAAAIQAMREALKPPKKTS